MIKTINELIQYKTQLFKPVKGYQILVSLGTCGIAAGTNKIKEAFKSSIEQTGADVNLIDVGCMGLCHSEPTIEVIDNSTGNSTIYGNVTENAAKEIVNSCAKNAQPVGCTIIKKNWYYPEIEEKTDLSEIQARIVLRNSGKINPEIIDHYIINDGYLALAKCLCEMTPEQVVSEITESNLRGRGGGGFPTGKKWSFAATQDNFPKYIVCNADEGDPGAFMDRAVLEGDPHSVIEAMIIAGYAIGANLGIVYIRAEYPLAIARLKIAIKHAREKGFLGKNIFGAGFDFDIEIKYGAGAFVCGEETALIHSIEGKRGEPKFKPPYPAVSGLWGKPTVVNNVETFANVGAIIRKGAKWFKKTGTKGSPGTKIFALAGKVKKVGLVEVPMGTTLREMIFDVGGGIINDKDFKAVQTGGPSGGCLKFDQLDAEIDYESLKAMGSMMGSGGMIVMDEDDCMVNVAKFFLEFTLDESCGKCTPCRIGNKRLHEMLEKICDGRGKLKTLTKLKDLGDVIKTTSLCGLGQTSANPVLSTIDQFPEEYSSHITDKRCLTGTCKSLIRYEINDKCVGCTICARNCPTLCIEGSAKQSHVIEQNKCVKCGVCFDLCKFNAIDRK